MRAARFLPLLCLLMIQSAFGVILTTGSGSITGIFENPSPVCNAVPDTDTNPAPGVECSESGKDTISWGNSFPSDPNTTGPNQFIFSGNSFSGLPISTPFVAGLLFYHNGSIAIGSEINTVDLKLTSSSTDPGFGGLLPLNITIVQTENFGISRDADADFMYFTDHPDFGSFRVYEGEATTVEILAQFDDLVPLGFGDVSDPNAGFVSPSIDAIPAPPTWALLAFPLAGLGLRRLRRQGRLIQ